MNLWDDKLDTYCIRYSWKELCVLYKYSTILQIVIEVEILSVVDRVGRQSAGKRQEMPELNVQVTMEIKLAMKPQWRTWKCVERTLKQRSRQNVLWVFVSKISCVVSLPESWTTQFARGGCLELVVELVVLREKLFTLENKGTDSSSFVVLPYTITIR